jgi:hypothetical protein
MKAPRPGDEVTVYDRPARITAVNVEASTFCVVWLDTQTNGYEGDRSHDIPWPVLVGQNWACDYTEAEAPLAR